MKDLLEYDALDVSEENDKKFGSRPGSFFYILAYKTQTFTIIAAFVVIACVLVRRYLPSTFWLRIFDYSLAFFAVSYLVFFAHKIVSSWVKSGWKRLPVNYPSLPRQMLKTAALFIVVSLHFVVVYTVSIRCIYEKLDARGVFGDSFGALNSIVSTGALIGVWITLWLQYRQQLEDRKASVKRQQEEQKLADDRRRERWPVLVTKDLEGEVTLSGVNETGCSLFEISISFKVQNCSRCVVLNVLNKVSVHQGNPEDSAFVQNAPIRTYIESQADRSYDIKFVMTIPSEDNRLVNFLEKDNAIIQIRNVFGTALQFYYAIDEEYVMTIDKEVDSLSVLKAWRDALEVVQQKHLKKRATVVVKNELLVKELKARNVVQDKVLRVIFRACPQKYKLTEISESQYLALLKA